MGNLYDLDNMCPVAHNYALGTELNKVQADAAQVIGQLNKQHNMVLNAAGLAISTTDLQYKTANAIHYLIGGVMYKASADAAIACSPTSGITCAASKYAAYLVEVDASGAFTLQKGADATSEALALAALADVTPAATKAMVGIIYIQNNATEFIPGASAAGKGDFADDTTADTYLDFVGVDSDQFTADYTQTFAAIT